MKSPKQTMLIALRLLTVRLLILLLIANSIPQSFAASKVQSGRNTTSGSDLKLQPKEPSRPPVKRLSAAELTKPIHRGLSFPSHPSDAEFFKARIFAEPLVPMNEKVIPAENEALAGALVAFKAKNNREDISDLVHFLARYPQSRWKASIEANLGQNRYDQRYLSDALRYWNDSWETSKKEVLPSRKSVADQSISNLLLLESQLGLVDQLKKHVAEISHRTLTGSVALKARIGRDSLWAMEHHPEFAFKCGPYALNTLKCFTAKNKLNGCDPLMRQVPSSKRGTSLVQLNDWGEKLGLKLQMAKRSPLGDFIVPSVMHWKVGHFAAITAQKGGRYKVVDPTFGEDAIAWVSKQALESQTDGYFLVANGNLPNGWHQVSRQEGLTVWGKGLSTDQDQGKSPSCPQTCNSCPCPGMASWSVFTMNATHSIRDRPLSYRPPIGPEMSMDISYQLNQGHQPSEDAFTFTNFGSDWSLNWVSYLSVNSSNTITVNVRGGGYEVYPYDSGYAPDLTSQARMVDLGGGSYQRVLVDGSVENFTLSDPAGIVYMTSATDVNGNAATITYDSDFRISQITDACGNVSTFTYVSNSSSSDPTFYKVATITDAFSRTATFGYDTTGKQLVSITDPVGNVSHFSYSPQTSFINLLTTPYGSTSFNQYIPAGGHPSYPPVGLRITLPDGSNTVIENWIGEQKETYYWDREATSRYPMDPQNHNYSHCTSTRWLFEEAGSMESPVPNWTRKALEAPVVYTYDGETSQDYCGSTNKPSSIAQQMVGFTETVTISAAGTITPGELLEIAVHDASLPWNFGVSTEIVNYTVQAGDTVATIASGLAAAINANYSLQSYGIDATAAAGVITITSRSVNATSYTIAAEGPSVDIALAAGSNPAQVASIGGYATPGDVITITVNDTSFPGGTESINYTVQPGDTIMTIGEGICMAANANSNLQSIGMSVYWSSSYDASLISLKSRSSNSTTYAVSASSGATESISLNDPSLNGIVKTSLYARNVLGYVTYATDPQGRQLHYTYADNNIDLIKLEQDKFSPNVLIGQWKYESTYAPHSPTSYIDGSGNQTIYTYTSTFGQLNSIVDANGNTTAFVYDSNGYLEQAQGPLAGSDDVTTFNFWGYGALHTITNSEGYTRTFSYDGLNRLTQTAYPDGTSEQTTYDRLDAVLQSDRLGRRTTYSYDCLDQLSKEVDPLGRTTKYCWCECGSLMALTDPSGNKTIWMHDLEGRVTQKTYADDSSVQYVYDSINGNLKTKTDALNQTTNFVCNLDNSEQLRYYTNAVNATSATQTAYDTRYSNVVSIVNGWGTTNYTYNDYYSAAAAPATMWLSGIPVSGDVITIVFYNANLPGGQYTFNYTVATTDTDLATLAYSIANAAGYDTTLQDAGISVSSTLGKWTLSVHAAGQVTVDPSTSRSGGIPSEQLTTSGGGRLATVSNSVISNSLVSYAYDALGRTVNRSINGAANSTTWGYDAISRITSEANTLGTFNYAYVNNTSGSSKGDPRLASVTYPNSQVTNFSYLPTFQDERLQQIANLNPSSAVLSQFNYGYDSPGQIKQWQQQQNSTNAHYDLGYDYAGQLTSALSDSGSSFKAYISGTAHTGDVVSVTAYDASLTGTTPVGQETASYTVQSGDSLANIATGLATAIGTAMSNISATASASGQTVTISTSPNYTTQFTSTVTGTGATTSISLSGSSPIADLHKQLYYSYDCASNRIGVQGDSTGSFPTGLTTSATQYGYNNVNELVSTAAGGPIAFQATTTNPVKSAVVNVTEKATIGGSITVGDKLWIGVHDAALSQAENVSYVVQSGDSTTSIATALKNAINADTTLSGIGVTATSSSAVITISSSSVNRTTYIVTVNSGGTETITLNGSRGELASITPSTAFTANPTLASGSNTASVTAVSGGGTATTNTYPITISSASSTSLTYDANGNMTSDGTNSYAWDAENRLITITYSGSGNHSDFTYDGLGRCVKIVETTSGSVTSTKQFVWCGGNQPCEARDGSSTITAQYFSLGQTIGGTSNKYFYTLDHLGSIRELANNSGGIVYQQSFDPYGQPTVLVSSTAPDFGYAGYYLHDRSGLNLTATRAYSSSLGRFINRDLIEEDEEPNAFTYVDNDPINLYDPLGLQGIPPIPPPPAGSGSKGKKCENNDAKPPRKKKWKGAKGKKAKEPWFKNHPTLDDADSLNRHYEKHGNEMDAKSAEHYKSLAEDAVNFRDTAYDQVRPDGTVKNVDPQSGNTVIFTPNGTPITFFR